MIQTAPRRVLIYKGHLIVALADSLRKLRSQDYLKQSSRRDSTRVDRNQTTLCR